MHYQSEMLPEAGIVYYEVSLMQQTEEKSGTKSLCYI
jgi:hypothetical protein